MDPALQERRGIETEFSHPLHGLEGFGGGLRLSRIADTIRELMIAE